MLFDLSSAVSSSRQWITKSVLEAGVGIVKDGLSPEERTVLDIIALLFVTCAPVTLVLLQFRRQAEYGRFSEGVYEGGVFLPARLAWAIMESPSLLAPFVCWYLATDSFRYSMVNLVLMALFLTHYVNRTLVWTYTMRGGKPVHISILFYSLLFTSSNGYIQCRSLMALLLYPSEYMWSWRFVLGTVLFWVGMAINVHSDSVLRNLRKDKHDTGYHLPRGGLFEYVCQANYFGEIVEWSGFAIATWSPYGFAFMAMTCGNLIPRALASRQWYMDKFGDKFPQHRRAVIPFLL